MDSKITCYCNIKSMTDKKIDYSKQIIRKQSIVDTTDCIGHSKVCRHSSTTNFKLFDMYRRYINYIFSELLFFDHRQTDGQNQSHNPLCGVKISIVWKGL